MNIANIAISIVANVQGLQQGVQQAQAALAQLNTSVQNATNTSNKAWLSWRKSTFELGRDFQRAGQGLTRDITIPILGVGAAALKSAENYEEAMRNLRASSGLTGEAFQQLGKDFKAVSTQIPDSLQDIGKSMGILQSRTHLMGSALQDLERTEANLSRLTKEDFNEQINQTTRLFGDWGVKAGQHHAVLNELDKAYQLTGTSVNKMATELVYFGVPLRTLGFSLEQAIPLVAKFGAEGANTEQIFRGFRMGLSRMAKEGIKDPQQALELLEDRLIKAKSAGEASTIALAIFGKTAGPDIAGAVREGRLSIEQLRKTIADSKTDINLEEAATRTFAESMALLRRELELTLQPLGERLVKAFTDLRPVIERIIERVNEAVTWFTKLSPQWQDIVLGASAAAAALGPFLSALGNVIIALPALSKLVKLFLFGMTTPWGAAFTLATTALLVWMAVTHTSFADVQRTVVEFVTWLIPYWSTFWQGVGDLASGVLLSLYDTVKEVFNGMAGVMQASTDLMSGNFRDFVADLQTSGDQFRDYWKNVGDDIGRGVIGGTKKAFSSLAGNNADAAKQAAAGLDKINKEAASKAEQSAKTLGALLKKQAEEASHQAQTQADNIKKHYEESAAETNKHLDNLINKSKQLTPEQKLQNKYNQEVAGSQSRLNELMTGASNILGLVAAKYHALGEAKVQHLAHLKEEISHQERLNEKQDRFKRDLEVIQGKIRELRTSDPTQKIVAQYEHGITPTQASTMANAQATYNAQKAVQDQKKKDAAELTADQKRLEGEMARINNQIIRYEQGYGEGEVPLVEQLDAIAQSLTTNHKVFDLLDDDQKKWVLAIKARQGDLKEEKAGYESQKKYLGEYNAGIERARDLIAQQRAEQLKLLATDPLNQASLEAFHVAYILLNKEQAAYARSLADEIDATNAAKKARDDIRVATEAQAKNTKELNEHLVQVNAQINELTGKTIKHSRAVRDWIDDSTQLTAAQKEMLQELIKREELLDHIKKVREATKQLATDLKGLFSTAFNDLFEKGTGFFNGLMDGFRKMLQRMAAEYLASQISRLFASLIGSLVGAAASGAGGLGGDAASAGGGGSLGSAIRKSFGSMKVMGYGGAAMAGETMVVGDKGPEYFTPYSSGVIRPSGGGSGPVMPVTVNIMAHDLPSFNRSKGQVATDIGRMVRYQLERHS